MAVHADAAESVLAHAWRETASDEACMHVVVVNIDVDFHAFELSLTGLTDAEVNTTAPSRICRPGKKELLVTAVLLRAGESCGNERPVPPLRRQLLRQPRSRISPGPG